MPEQPNPKRQAWFLTAFVAAAVAAFSVTAPLRGLGQRLFASLRIEKPQAVNVNIPAFSGPNASRQLQDMIAGMIAEKVSVTLDEKEQTAPSAEAAGQLAGFTAKLPRARKDPPTLTVVGARAIDMPVKRAQLRTILAEAGKPAVALPQSLDGAVLRVRSPRAIRAQYGNCPAPVANTIQNQIQGPPPPSTDNGDCIVLTESPAASAEVPPGLDIEQLVDITLQLSGMSPIQAQAFQRTFDWKSTLCLTLPRGMRSYESVDVNGAHGMLLNTAGRRGPTYELIWVKDGMVYTLAGYGSSATAVPLATSTN